MTEYLGSQQIRALAKELDLRPTKKLGQNFVIDPNTIRKIVSAAELNPSDKVVEIGPGLGSLTLGLLDVVSELVVVEVDEKLANRLAKTVAEKAPGRRLKIINADALKIQSLPFEPTALVANLPYNISVPVLLHFLETFPSIKMGLVLVQAEVAERLVAKPGSKVYGAPSVKMAWYANASLRSQVSRNVFWPVPNVDSSLVYFEKRANPFHQSLREKVFALIDAAFAQRRKTLRQALQQWAGSPDRAQKILEECGISPQARGEQLSVEQFIELAGKK